MRIYKISHGGGIHRVREGDTYASIADKFDTVAEIVKAENGGGEFMAGDLVFVSDPQGVLYTARPLDTIAGIAKKFNVSPNDIFPADIENVYVGQKLLIKGQPK